MIRKCCPGHHQPACRRMFKWILLPTNSQLQPEHIKGFGDQHDGMKRTKWKNKIQTQYQKNITTYSLHPTTTCPIARSRWCWVDYEDGHRNDKKYHGEEEDTHDYSIQTISLKMTHSDLHNISSWFGWRSEYFPTFLFAVYFWKNMNSRRFTGRVWILSDW